MALYDAFVSYSHAKDKPIAAALQSVVQKLGKPWYRRRALRVFRDDTSLSATPSLWPSIEQALGQSRFLILLASPEAAASQWVNKEVAYWLEHKGADTLLIALTDGELAWDHALGDFARREGMPLPPVLTGRFPSEPKWVDLTAYRDGADPRDAKFTELAADFAAAVHGMPKEDLLSQEVRQQRRALTLAWSAAVTLLVLTGAAGWQWWKPTARSARHSATDRDRAEGGRPDQRDRAVAAEEVATEQKDIARTQRDLAERNFGDRQGRGRRGRVQARAGPAQRAGHARRVGTPDPRHRPGHDGQAGARGARRSAIAAQPFRHAGGIQRHLSERRRPYARADRSRGEPRDAAQARRRRPGRRGTAARCQRDPQHLGRRARGRRRPGGGAGGLRGESRDHAQARGRRSRQRGMAARRVRAPGPGRRGAAGRGRPRAGIGGLRGGARDHAQAHRRRSGEGRMAARRERDPPQARRRARGRGRPDGGAGGLRGGARDRSQARCRRLRATPNGSAA